ncbi:hypothetical protein D9M71_537910 [compost metagenome]
MAGQLVLQVTGFGQVIKQYQLPGLGIQRARGNRQAPAITQRHLVAVILARSEAASDHLTPQLTLQRLAKQVAGSGIGLTHAALAIDDNDPAGQQVKQVLQTVGQALLLGQLGHALGTDHRQLALELGDPGFEQAVGLTELGGHLIEHGKSLFKTKAAFLLGGVWPLRLRDTGDGSDLGHRALSRD